jgi:hypothetical protein
MKILFPCLAICKKTVNLYLNTQMSLFFMILMLSNNYFYLYHCICLCQKSIFNYLEDFNDFLSYNVFPSIFVRLPCPVLCTAGRLAGGSVSDVALDECLSLFILFLVFENTCSVIILFSFQIF